MGFLVCRYFNFAASLLHFFSFPLQSKRCHPRNTPLTSIGFGRLEGCQMLKITRCVDSPLTDGGKPYTPPPSTPHNSYFSAPFICLCYRLSNNQRLVGLEVLDKLKQIIHLIVSRSRDLPAFDTVPQPTTPLYVPPTFIDLLSPRSKILLLITR
jgi:hypothetical protein